MDEQQPLESATEIDVSSEAGARSMKVRAFSGDRGRLQFSMDPDTARAAGAAILELARAAEAEGRTSISSEEIQSVILGLVVPDSPED